MSTFYKNYIFMTTDKDRPKKRKVEISVPDVRDRNAVSKALAAAAPDRHVHQLPAGQSLGVCDCPPVPSA